MNNSALAYSTICNNYRKTFIRMKGDEDGDKHTVKEKRRKELHRRFLIQKYLLLETPMIQDWKSIYTLFEDMGDNMLHESYRLPPINFKMSRFLTNSHLNI